MSETNQETATLEPREAKIAVDQDSREVQANKLYQMAWTLIYGKRKSVERAIKCVQRAITFNDSSHKYWQLLGEAYYQRGSLNPAINCFMKSLRLVDEMRGQTEEHEKTRTADIIYSRLRMSDIRLSVGHLDEALKGYLEIIAQEPSNLAALIGLTKTELQLARNSFSSNLVNSGHLHIIRALKYSLRTIKLCSHLSLTWKLASDCCLIQFVYGQRGDFKSIIEENFPDDDSEYILLNRNTCVDLSQQFLCRALAIEPFHESACLWHNLGISLYFKSKLIKQETVQKSLLRRSIKCLIRALSFDRNNSQIKSSIGVVAFHLNLLNAAQSFIIKSIRNNLSTSEMQFSNLGFMYLQKGEFRLAGVAFSRCQAEEPIYSRSWLGRALVEEQSNSTNLSLLRHCHRLEDNYQSLLLYATRIVSLPYTDEFSKDLYNALDCMRRIINYDTDSLEATNTLGLLLERSGYLDQALATFDRAYQISNQDSRVIVNKLRQHARQSMTCWSCENQDGATINSDFIKLAEKLGNSNNREYMLNFIYYLFNSGDYKSVNIPMTRFMDKLNQRDVSSKACAQILLGLSSRAESGDFKSWFFKNIIDLEGVVCIEGLINIYCLMLFASLDHDRDLLHQMAIELPKALRNYLTLSSRSKGFIDLYHSSQGCWIRLALITSIFCLEKPRLLIQPLLALYPMVAELWLFLGISFSFRKQDYPAAIICLKHSLLIGATRADLCFVSNLLLAILSQATAKNKLATLESRDKYLSRSILSYPQYGLLWKSLSQLNIETKASSSQRKSNSLADNFELFDLAIKHVIKMCLA